MLLKHQFRRHALPIRSIDISKSRVQATKRMFPRLAICSLENLVKALLMTGLVIKRSVNSSNGYVISSCVQKVPAHTLERHVR